MFSLFIQLQQSEGGLDESKSLIKQQKQLTERIWNLWLTL